MNRKRITYIAILAGLVWVSAGLKAENFTFKADQSQSKRCRLIPDNDRRMSISIGNNAENDHQIAEPAELVMLRDMWFFTDRMKPFKAPPDGTPVIIQHARPGGVEVVPIPRVAFYDDFMREEKLQLTVLDGVWKLGGQVFNGDHDNPFCLLAQGEGRVRFGRQTWADYYAAVALRCPSNAQQAGLAIGDLAFTVGTEGFELRDKDKRLARGDLKLRPGQWYDIRLAAAGDRAWAYIDGHAVLDQQLKAWYRGPAGLILRGSGIHPVEWDDLRAGSLPLSTKTDLKQWIADTGRTFRSGYLDRSEMRATDSWVGARGMWLTMRDFYVTRTPFFDDVDMLVKNGLGPGTRLTLSGDRHNPAHTGYRLECDEAQVRLFRGAEQIAAKEMAAAGRTIFRRRGGRVSLRINDREILAYEDPEPLAGRSAAFRPLKPRPDLTSIEVTSPRYYDYTFQNAPVDWTVLAGAWGVRSMWACAPQYTWYSANADWPTRLQTIRCKRVVAGDFFVEYSTGTKMLYDQTPYYNYPWNMTLAFSPDPNRPLAGVAVVFGGPDLGIRVFREGKLLKKHQPFGPGQSFYTRRKFSLIKDTLHEVWYKLAVQREGDGLAVYFNDLRVLQCPVKGLPATGHLFFTGLDNNFVLGRVRLSLQGGGRREPPEPSALDPQAALAAAEEIIYHGDEELPASLHLLTGARPEAQAPAKEQEWARTWRDSFKALMGFDYQGSGFREGRYLPAAAGGSDGVRVFYLADRKGCVRVVKPGTGGLSVCPLVDNPFRLEAFPQLRFDYRMPFRTSPGLMIVTDRKTYFVDFDPYRNTHKDSWVPRADGPRLNTDGRWHSALLDLRTYVPGNPVIEKIALCDAGWQSGVRGTWYELDNLVLIPVIDSSLLKEPRQAEGVMWQFADGGKIDVIKGVAGDMEIRLPVIGRAGYKRPKIPAAAIPVAPVIRIIYPDQLTSADFGDAASFGQAGNRGGLLSYAKRAADSFNGIAANVERAPFNRWENYFYLYRRPFSIDRYPLLTIRYKPVSYEWWLGGNIRNDVYGIFDTYNRKGKELRDDRKDRKPDGQWHTETIDLRKSFGRYRRKGEDDLVIQQLFLSGAHMYRGRQNLLYAIDYFDIASPRTDRIRAEWTPVPGAGYAWALSRETDRLPAATTATSEAFVQLESLVPGRYWFHLKTVGPDGADSYVRQAFTVERQP